MNVRETQRRQRRILYGMTLNSKDSYCRLAVCLFAAFARGLAFQSFINDC